MKTLLATLLLLGACVQGDYLPQEQEVKLTILNFDEMQVKYIEYGGRLPRATRGKKVPKISGFMLLGSKPCQVWVAPRGLWDGTLLHELKHCDKGDYHLY